MTYRATPPRESGHVSARVLWSKRFVVPLIAVGLCALVTACVIAVHGRAELVVTPYAPPRSREAIRDVLFVPAHVDVASYSLRVGLLGFGDESTGNIQDFYDRARVVRTAVSLSEARSRQRVDSVPDKVTLGEEPDALARGNERVATEIEAWMRGKHEAPLHIVWWSAPASEMDAFAAIAALALLVLLLASRTRVRVASTDNLVEVESRSAFRTRRATLARNEVRTITVESRVVGPAVFARAVVVTNDNRKIPVGPRCMTDEAAAELAQRIRALIV